MVDQFGTLAMLIDRFPRAQLDNSFTSIGLRSFAFALPGEAMAALVVVWSVSHIRTYATPGRRDALPRDAPPSAGCLRSDKEQFAATGIPLGRLLLAWRDNIAPPW